MEPQSRTKWSEVEWSARKRREWRNDGKWSDMEECGDLRLKEREIRG